jgi:hypothetical protein
MVESMPVDEVPATPAQHAAAARLSKIAGVAADVDSLSTASASALMSQTQVSRLT